MTTDDDKPYWKHGLPRCDHATAQAVRVPSGVREQCPACGKLDSVRLRLTDHPNAAPADDAAAKRWADARVAAGVAAMTASQKKFVIKKASKTEANRQWFDNYADFLKTPAWQAMRGFVLTRDNGVCQAFLPGCHRRASEVHHRAYDLHRAIGMQPAFDLVAICSFCHAEITKAERAAKK